MGNGWKIFGRRENPVTALRATIFIAFISVELRSLIIKFHKCANSTEPHFGGGYLEHSPGLC